MQGKKDKIKIIGCSKYTCTKTGRKFAWIESFASEKCCNFNNTGSPIGANMMSIQLPDMCTSVAIMCIKKEGYADIQLESDKSQCPKRPRKILLQYM